MTTNDNDSKLLAVVASQTTAILKELEGMNKNIDELYSSRNEIKERLTKIETQHADRTAKGDCPAQPVTTNQETKENSSSPWQVICKPKTYTSYDHSE